MVVVHESLTFAYLLIDQNIAIVKNSVLHRRFWGGWCLCSVK
jgi:hypothetical protein